MTTAELLSQALGMEKSGVLGIITRHDGYAVIKRRITPAESAAIQRLKSDGRLAGSSPGGGFGRFYPQGRLASHVVGYVGADNVALDGIEYTFNDDLAPQPVGKDNDTVYGNQVFLTIDLDIQYLVDKVARAALAADKADSITVLVMDAHSGEILAYTALPDFDPNEFQRESPQIDPNSLVNRPLTSHTNRVLCSRSSPSPPCWIWVPSHRRAISSAPATTRRSFPAGKRSASAASRRTVT